jgi:hypothetical protein
MSTVQKRVRWNQEEWTKFFLSMELTDTKLSDFKRIEKAMEVFEPDRRRKLNSKNGDPGIMPMYKAWKANGGKLNFNEVYVKQPVVKARSPWKSTAAVSAKEVAKNKSAAKIVEAVSGVDEQSPRSLRELMTRIPSNKQSDPPVAVPIHSLATKRLLEQLEQTQREIEANIDEARRIRSQAEEARKKLPEELREAMKEIQRGLDNQIGAMEVRMTAKLEAVYTGLAKIWLGDGTEIPSLALTTPVVTCSPVESGVSDLAGKQLAQALSKKPKVLVFGVLASQARSIQNNLPTLEIVGTKDMHKAQGSYVMAVVMRDKLVRGQLSSSDY